MRDTLLVQLLPQGTNEAEELHPMWGMKVMKVVNDDWDSARDAVIRACCMTGRKSVIFVHGHAELYEKRHSTVPFRITRHGQHGLWLYMDRLLQRFGHVYVPPLTEANDLPHYHNSPCKATVVGYQLAALQRIKTWDGPLGLQLCEAGYDSFTVRDYFYYCRGHEAFVETGTRQEWERAFMMSYKPLL